MASCALHPAFASELDNTGPVPQHTQAFNSQVVAHLRNYKPEIGRIDGQLKELKESDGRLEAMIRGVEVCKVQLMGGHVTAACLRAARVSPVLAAALLPGRYEH